MSGGGPTPYRRQNRSEMILGQLNAIGNIWRLANPVPSAELL